MKRQIILFITLSLLLSIASFVGCGGGGTTTVSPIQPVSTSTPSSPDVPTQIPTEIQSTPTPIVTYTPSSTTIELQQQIDAAGGGWTAGNNPVAALSDEDKTARCGCDLSIPISSLEAYNVTSSQVPSSFNRYSYLSSVKDQGNVGTCVAFAAVASVESCVKVALNDASRYLDLSEAHLFHYGGGNVSSGWYLNSAAEYFKNTGVPPESYFEYNPATVASGNSKTGWQNYVTKTTSWQYLGNTAAIKDYIYNYGPVMSGFDVYRDFFYYKSGVYRYITGSRAGGHAICIYGWDDSAGCWLVKNSWGYSWGENGTFRIAYGQCNIEKWSIGMKYTVPANTPTPVITPTKTPTPGVTATPTPGYVFVRKWGSSGTGDGQLGSPLGITISPYSGFIYVVENKNARIQGFAKDGTFITKWGSSGTGDEQFNVPCTITIDSSGNIYITDNNYIKKFTQNGAFITKWGGNGSSNGQFNGIQGIAIDSSGNIYVSDTGNNRIQKFTSSGNFITKWGNTGTGDGQFNSPRGIAISPSGNVLIADWGNARIQKFTSSGTFITKWGAGGKPDAVAVDTSENVYTTNVVNNAYIVMKFTSAGSTVAQWGSQGTGNGQFMEPHGITVDSSSGYVYVTDSQNNNVQVFKQQ